MTTQSSEAERARRGAQLVRIRHSTEMEAGRSSGDARADQDACAQGEITAHELVARMMACGHLELLRSKATGRHLSGTRGVVEAVWQGKLGPKLSSDPQVGARCCLPPARQL